MRSEETSLAEGIMSKDAQEYPLTKCFQRPLRMNGAWEILSHQVCVTNDVTIHHGYLTGTAMGNHQNDMGDPATHSYIQSSTDVDAKTGSTLAS